MWASDDPQRILLSMPQLRQFDGLQLDRNLDLPVQKNPDLHLGDLRNNLPQTIERVATRASKATVSLVVKARSIPLLFPLDGGISETSSAVIASRFTQTRITNYDSFQWSAAKKTTRLVRLQFYFWFLCELFLIFRTNGASVPFSKKKNLDERKSRE